MSAPPGYAPSSTPASAGFGPQQTAPGLVIPYDYGAKFTLKGIPGNSIEDVINITPESAFVATAIGYGFFEERGTELQVPWPNSPAITPSFKPGNVTLEQIPPQALVEGFRAHPRFESSIFEIDPTGRIEPRFSEQELPAADSKRIFQQIRVPTNISFFVSIVDSGTGRELQDVPSHNLASLGKSNGERPFRLLAKPLSFLPRSTIRIQIVEASEGAKGDLYIVLFGYKVLVASGCPEPVVRASIEEAARPLGAQIPRNRIIPFDYVSTLRLTGKTGNLVEDEVPINVDGGFVATALGYALLVEQAEVKMDIEKAKDPTLVATAATPLFPRGQGTPILNLAKLPLKVFTPDALTDGIRIRPSFLRFAFQNNGALANQAPLDLVESMFERVNRPEDVSFRYDIFDTGTGRELQNMRLHNVAGLGIANGDRPFKQFARPMHFQARSTIRVSVLEGFGRGTLYLVFQGYKVLGSGPSGVRSW